MKEVERVCGAERVPRVQCTYSLDRSLDNVFIAWLAFDIGVGEVTQNREMEVCFAVGEKLNLEIFERPVDRIDASEQGRNDDGCAQTGGYPVVVEIQLRQRAWRQEGRDELKTKLRKKVRK